MNTPMFNVGGAAVSRLEDLRLLTGGGQFAADWNLPGQLFGYFLRSDVAHGRIVSLDFTAAKVYPGVHAVLTGEDAVRAGYIQPVSFFNFPGKNGARPLIPPWPVLAHERVRFVGEAVAFVVADTADIAQDACALIQVQYEVLPCAVDGDAALTPGAVLLRDGHGATVSFGAGLTGYVLARSTMQWTAAGRSSGFNPGGSALISAQSDLGPVNAAAPISK